MAARLSACGPVPSVGSPGLTHEPATLPCRIGNRRSRRHLAPERVGRSAGTGGLHALGTQAADGRHEAVSQFQLSGLHCAGIIENALTGLPGVTNARVSAAASRVQVRWDPQRTRAAALIGVPLFVVRFRALATHRIHAGFRGMHHGNLHGCWVP